MQLRRFIVSGCLSLCVVVPTLAHAGGALFAEDVGALANACGATGCWTNYLRLTDLDGDDDLDVVAVNYSGFFSAGTAEPLVVYTNDGAGNFTETSATSVGDFVGRIRQVAIGDVDGDGDPDMYAPDGNGGVDNLFINDGSGSFEPTEIDIGSNAGAARFADFDDDGDLDLFLADGYNAAETVHGHIYTNDGDGNFTELADAIPAPSGGSDPDDVDVLDVDGDWDLDILLNNHSGDNELWLNNGDGTFADASAGLPGVPGGFHYNPGVCDVDGDGDLDVWIDNMGPDYSEMLTINDGSGVFSDETTQVAGNSGDDDNGVACIDVDYDGDFDAVVISLFTAERYFENDGAGNFGYLAGVFTGAGNFELWGEFGDVNGDGRLDLVTGAGEGSPSNERVFLGTVAQTADITPPAFRAVQTLETAEPDTDVVLHFAVTDNAVTDEGPRLHSAFVRVTVGGDEQEIPAMFVGGDVFRAVLPGQPDGTTVDVEACATDREDNEGCAAAFSYEVGEGAATTGDTGTSNGTDTDPTDPDGSESAEDVGTLDDTGTASNTDTNGSASLTSEDADASDSDDDSSTGDTNETDPEGGCNCTQSGSGKSAFWLALLAVVLPMRRRRLRNAST